MVLAQHSCAVCLSLIPPHSGISLTAAREEECHCYDLSECCSLFKLPGPGGLLLDVSHLFAIPVLVLWVPLAKLNLDVTKKIARSHTEQQLK